MANAVGSRRTCRPFRAGGRPSGRCARRRARFSIVPLAAVGVLVASFGCGPGAAPSAADSQRTPGRQRADRRACFDAPIEPDRDPKPVPVGLASDDLPDRARWSGANCIYEKELSPAVELYREHNRRQIEKQLQSLGLSLRTLPRAKAPLENVDIDSVITREGRRWILGELWSVFAEDRCGVIHRIEIRGIGPAPIPRTVTLCGCSGHTALALLVEQPWLSAADLPPPSPPSGVVSPPEPLFRYRYELPKGARVGGPVSTSFHDFYRLHAYESYTDGRPCEPPP